MPQTPVAVVGSRLAGAAGPDRVPRDRRGQVLALIPPTGCA